MDYALIFIYDVSLQMLIYLSEYITRLPFIYIHRWGRRRVVLKLNREACTLLVDWIVISQIKLFLVEYKVPFSSNVVLTKHLLFVPDVTDTVWICWPFLFIRIARMEAYIQITRFGRRTKSDCSWNGLNESKKV